MEYGMTIPELFVKMQGFTCCRLLKKEIQANLLLVIL